MARYCCALLVLLVCCWVGQMNCEFKFTMDDLQQQLGYFGKCKGKKINYPTTAITAGFANVGTCIAAISFPLPGSPYTGVALTKPCVAQCVAEYMKIVDKETRLYNITVAAKPLLETVNSTDPAVHNDEDVINIQVEALRRCGTTGPTGPPKFLNKLQCDEAVKFDQCITNASITDCGNEPRKQ